MHDDRIAGVTFVGNTSCNALIVNEEYAWVGNPFSAPKQEGRIQKVLPFLFCMPVHEGLGICDLKTPLPGAGDVCQNSRKRSRAAQVRVRVRVPFSAPKQEGRIQKVLSSFAYRNRKADIDNLRMHVQGGDMADTASHRRTYTQHRPPFSLQRSATEQSESIFLNMHVFYSILP